MSRTISSFDMIIRKIERGASMPNGYKALYFDERNRSVLRTEPSFFQRIGKKVETYIVSVNETVKCDGFTYIFDTGIGLSVSYTAKCSQNNEEKVLKELYDEGKSFETMLNDRLRNFLAQYLDEKQESISVRLLKNAEESLSKSCLFEIAVLISPVISFQAEANLKRFQIKSGPFSIRLKDYNETLSMEYDMEIWPGKDNLEKALLKLPSADSLNNKIKEIILKETWENISLNQFCLALNFSNEDFEITAKNKPVKDVLLEPINLMLIEEGRMIGHLELISASVENIKPKEHLEIEHLFSYKIADENEFIGVKSTVSLRLIDIAAFKKAEERYQIKKNSTTVEGWFKESVITPLIKDILFDKAYKDILLHPDSIKDEIKESISIKAREIGYRIKQHTHMPDIKKLKLREGFTISMQDEEFETKSSDVKIKLNITIKGKVTNLDELGERLLHPAVDIESEMKTEIRSAIEDKIHAMEPEQIYLKFTYTGEKDNPPVDKILSAEVSKCLVEKFEVDERSLKNVIKLSQSEDEFVKKTRELRKDLRKFEVKVYPVSKDSYVEPLVFEIQYRIRGVDQSGWSIFLSRISKDVSIQFEELEGFLKALLTEKLNSVDYATLKSENIESKELIKHGASAYAAKQVADKFGLLIEFYTFLRARSETEVRAIRTALEIFEMEETGATESRRKEIESIQKKIELLRSLEEEAIRKENTESARDFNQQIEALKNATISKIPETGNIRKQIQDSKSSSNVIKDLFGDSFKALENKPGGQTENSA